LDADLFLHVFDHTEHKPDCLFLPQYPKLEVIAVMFQDLDVAELEGKCRDDFYTSLNCVKPPEHMSGPHLALLIGLGLTDQRVTETTSHDLIDEHLVDLIFSQQLPNFLDSHLGCVPVECEPLRHV